MSDAEQAEAAVKKVWPDASWVYFSALKIPHHIHSKLVALGYGHTEDEAWLDAASKLQSPPVEEK